MGRAQKVLTDVKVETQIRSAVIGRPLVVKPLSQIANQFNMGVEPFVIERQPCN